MIKAAIDEAFPASVLTAVLYERFCSRGESGFAYELVFAMRYEFGGHANELSSRSRDELNRERTTVGAKCYARRVKTSIPKLQDRQNGSDFL